VRKSHEELGKTTHINWRPVTDTPADATCILIANDNHGIKKFCTSCVGIEEDTFGEHDIAWAYVSDINWPSFPDPALELARKLRSCTEEDAVKILKERGVK
jgi:hypothetical protein